MSRHGRSLGRLMLLLILTLRRLGSSDLGWLSASFKTEEPATWNPECYTARMNMEVKRGLF